MTEWPTSKSLGCYLNGGGHSLQRELASYVTFSIDNLVSLCSWNRHLKGQISSNHQVTRVCHTFLRTPIPGLNRTRGFRCVMSQHYLFFEIRRICHSTRLLVRFPARLCALSFIECVKSLLCSLSKVHMFDKFF